MMGYQTAEEKTSPNVKETTTNTSKWERQSRSVDKYFYTFMFHHFAPRFMTAVIYVAVITINDCRRKQRIVSPFGTLACYSGIRMNTENNNEIHQTRFLTRNSILGSCTHRQHSDAHPLFLFFVSRASKTLRTAPVLRTLNRISWARTW
jgi:hypothetical protein